MSSDDEGLSTAWLWGKGHGKAWLEDNASDEMQEIPADSSLASFMSGLDAEEAKGPREWFERTYRWDVTFLCAFCRKLCRASQQALDEAWDDDEQVNRHGERIERNAENEGYLCADWCCLECLTGHAHRGERVEGHQRDYRREVLRLTDAAVIMYVNARVLPGKMWGCCSDIRHSTPNRLRVHPNGHGLYVLWTKGKEEIELSRSEVCVFLRAYRRRSVA